MIQIICVLKYLGRFRTSEQPEIFNYHRTRMVDREYVAHTIITCSTCSIFNTLYTIATTISPNLTSKHQPKCLNTAR